MYMVGELIYSVINCLTVCPCQSSFPMLSFMTRGLVFQSAFMFHLCSCSETPHSLLMFQKVTDTACLGCSDLCHTVSVVGSLRQRLCWSLFLFLSSRFLLEFCAFGALWSLGRTRTGISNVLGLLWWLGIAHGRWWQEPCSSVLFSLFKLQHMCYKTSLTA